MTTMLSAMRGTAAAEKDMYVSSRSTRRRWVCGLTPHQGPDCSDEVDQPRLEPRRSSPTSPPYRIHHTAVGVVLIEVVGLSSSEGGGRPADWRGERGKEMAKVSSGEDEGEQRTTELLRARNLSSLRIAIALIKRSDAQRISLQPKEGPKGMKRGGELDRSTLSIRPYERRAACSPYANTHA